MTGNVVNLRAFRKARARTDKNAQAAANRRKFGRTKSEKCAEKAAQERETRLIEGARRDRDEDDED